MRPESPICTLGKLIEYAEAGGYCVPADLLAAHQAHRRLTSLNVEPSPAATRQGVAERLATGKALDPLDLAAELVAGQALRDREAKAAEVLRYAVELSAEALASLAAAMTQRIVTEHLRPAPG